MTVSEQRVRAFAQVRNDARSRAEPAVLLPRRRPGRLGPLHLTQLLLAEVTVVAVLAATGQDLLVVIGAAVAGLVVLGVVFGRRQGRWWLERQLITRQFRRRRGFRPAVGADPRIGALRCLAPELTVTDVGAADGAQVGVARDDAGWYAVAAVTPHAPLRGEADPGLPLDAMMSALAETGQPGASLQVVTHTVPSPSLGLHPGAPASLSYRHLLATFGQAPVPVNQTTWMAVRLDARTLAELGASDEELGTTPTVVAALARRVGTLLRHAGVSYQVCDAEGLLGALSRSCDVDSPAPNGGAVPVREDWEAWHSSRLAHRSFWLREWPAVEHAKPLLDWLCTVPAAMSSLSLTMTNRDDDRTVDLRCLLRVAAPVYELPELCRAIMDGARRAGAELFPLNGEQGPAVYASAPTGGGPQ